MRYKIDFSYDGSDFKGFEKQKGLRTIQGDLEEALKKINAGKSVKVVASGRTDAKVNAMHQVAHVDLNIKNITPYKLMRALNSTLENDIYINDVSVVNDDFHARYMVKKKTYEYKINTGKYSPILRRQVFQYGKQLDIIMMKEAAKDLEGTHDFTTFSSAEDARENKVRTIFKIKITKKADIISIVFVGDGFLKYQIRNMVGLLIKIGEGKESEKSVPILLSKKDRRAIGKTAPAEGLTLIKIEY